MGRIGDAVVRGARTVRRIPIPSAVSLPALQEARRARPQGGVLKRHGVEVEMIGRTRCIWLDEHRADQGIIVHLHGGAYVSGPFASDWAWLSRQAQAQDCAALMVDYRTAPDHTHPIAIEDTEAVLRALTEDGRLRAGNWVLTGQHAGGGLALTVARRLVEQAAQQESSAVTLHWGCGITRCPPRARSSPCRPGSTSSWSAPASPRPGTPIRSTSGAPCGTPPAPTRAARRCRTRTAPRSTRAIGDCRRCISAWA